MRNESRKYRKSSSWPKAVMKKWLNIRTSSADFVSDSNSHKGGGGGGGLTRRKSWSDKDNSFLITRDSLGTLSLSLGHGGWLVTTSQLDPIPPATKNLKAFVGTWNVGGKAPHEALDLRDWLLPADLYVIGFQEIVPLNAGNVLGAEDEGPASTWLSLIRRALNAGEKADGDDSDGGRRYCLAASKQMVGIFLCVWAREGVAEHVRNVKVSCVGTGIMGYMGNKGSVSISMTIRRSTLCFVCSHLSSGEKDGDEARRNSDVMEILKRTSFSRAKEIAPAKILQHDKVIWLGDLNYRLAASGCDDATREMIEKNDWQALLERDQLRIEQGAGRILRGWEEGKISFPPTYKYLPNSDCYAFTTTKPGDKRRSPAWCDRILWRGNGMKQMSYSRDESRFSDHRPVHSLFSIEVDNYDRFQDTAAAAANSCSGNSSCSRVRAQELLVITRTQSCLSATRF